MVRLLHILSDIETWMRWLVICHILPGDTHPIHRILHERLKAVFCRSCSRVNTQLLTILGSPNHFFSPVAQQVGTQSRRSLGPVIGRCPFGLEQQVRGFLLPVPFCNAILSKQLPLEVVIPPERKIARSRLMLRNLLTFYIKKAVNTTTAHPYLSARVLGINVSRQSAAGPFALIAGGHRGFLPEDLARISIAQVCSGIIKSLLDVKNFHARIVGIQIPKMQGISMTDTR